MAGHHHRNRLLRQPGGIEGCRSVEEPSERGDFVAFGPDDVERSLHFLSDVSRRYLACARYFVGGVEGPKPRTLAA